MTQRHRNEGPGVDAWETLLRAHARLVPTLEVEVEASSGMPLSWYDVLLELYRDPEGIRMGDLGERVVLSRSRVSRIVDELVRAGHVRREDDATDGRGKVAVITPSGERAVRRTAPIYLAGIESHFSSHLGPAELRSLGDLLQRVLDAESGGA